MHISLIRSLKRALHLLIYYFARTDQRHAYKMFTLVTVVIARYVSGLAGLSFVITS